MKILITGALGHIGSKLIRVIAQKYSSVKLILLDNLATQRYASLFDLPDDGNYKFIEANILATDLNPIVEQIDVVIHLAAITDATNSINEPEQIYQNNLATTKRIAESCAAHNKPIFFPSTTSVYRPKTDTVDEDCSNQQLRPQSPYAKCKLKEENLLINLHRQQNLPVAICRFGTIFGTSHGMRFHTAVNKFCWQAITGQPLTVWETAYKQKRPYLSLQDAIRVICFILKQNLFNGEILNAVTANYTVQEVITCIQSLVPTLKVQLVNNSVMNDLSFEVLNTKLTKQGFAFVGNLQEDIQQTFNLLKNVNNFTMEIK